METEKTIITRIPIEDIIKKTLEKLEYGDILLYLDGGCELNVQGKDKFLNMIDIVKDKKIIGTCASSNDIIYTKMDLIKYFNMENDIEKLKQNHMQAGALLMLKCDIIVNLCNEWYNIASNNYNLIDDSPSINSNFDNFIEHRHDQSVYNLLVKKYNLINYLMDPVSFNNIKDALLYPIWYCRNRSGTSIKK